MTAEELLVRHLATPFVCQRCGLIDDVRISAPAPLCRIDAVRCRCGQVLALVESPPALVPFGFLAGQRMDEIPERDVQWVHDRATHPWVLATACALTGCTRSRCGPSWSEYMAGILPPDRAARQRARADYVKTRAATIRERARRS